MLLQGKVFIVTGAKSGIGKATALLLGQRGAAVGLIDVSAPEDVADEIESLGGEAVAIQCDVQSAAQVEDAVKSVVHKFGPLNGAANLAGIIGSGQQSGPNSGSLLTMADDTWDRIMAVNLNGVKNCLRAELRHFSPSGCSIVNASSVSARIGSPYNAAYSASKAAIVALTKSVAHEMGELGVRINAVAPGATETAMLNSLPTTTKQRWSSSNALKRAAQPVEIANAILFLLGEESSFCTGMVLDVDAGRV